MPKKVYKEILTLIQSSPGRARFQYDRDRPDVPDIDQFLEIPGVNEVTYSVITKSVLIIYDQQVVTLDDLAHYIEDYMPPLEVRRGKAWGEVPFGHDMLSQLIYGGLAKANRHMRKKLNGVADLTSIVPSMMVVWSMAELALRPTRPGWFDILRAVEIYVTSIASHQHH